MNELENLIQAIRGLADINEDELNDETLQLLITNVNEQFTPQIISQSINQIIKNLDDQGLTKKEAEEAMAALANTLKEMVYGEEQFTGKKKILVDSIMEKMLNIFDDAANKYHTFSIDLPMTVAPGAKVPSYAHATDAAADIYAMVDQDIPAYSRGNKINTGIRIQLPEGWLAMILPRSSMGTKTGLRLSNSVGLIDSGYRGELGVLYDNISNETYHITAGDRIAQLLVMPSYRFQAKVVDILADSDRGETGFGDSGK